MGYHHRISRVLISKSEWAAIAEAAEEVSERDGTPDVIYWEGLWFRRRDDDTVEVTRWLANDVGGFTIS